MRNINLHSPAVTLNIQFRNGGLGDQVCRLPAVKFLLDTAKNLEQIQLFVPDYFVDFARELLNEYPTKRVLVLPESFLIHADKKIPCLITNEDYHSSMKTHLVDYTFRVLADMDVENEHKNYLQLRLPAKERILHTLPPEYVVISTGFTAPVRCWLPESVNKVVDWIKEQGLRVVFLGKKNVDDKLKGSFLEQVNYQKGIDLTDKTTLVEACHIMGYAKAVVGLDNGLLHVAGCTKVPIVAGYSSVAPQFRLPYRNGVLGWNCYTVEPDEHCRYCQSSCLLNGEQDFRLCFYKDYHCIKSLSAPLWIEQLKKALNK